jgi:hypothetical protein
MKRVLALWFFIFAAQQVASSAEIHVIPGASQPHVAVSNLGHILVVCLWKGDIAVCVSNDRGKSITAPLVAIDSGGRAARGYQRGPRVGVDAAGRIYVTGFARFERAPDLFLTTSANDGASWSGPLRINDRHETARHSLHWMDVTPTGQVHIAWLDLRNGPQSVDVFYANVIDGVPSKNIQIATNVCECCAPGLSVDSQGNLFLAYREGGEKSSRELYSIHSGDGGKSFAAPVQLNQRPSLEDG